MGDPKRLRKTYSAPLHPWDAERIEEEKQLIKEYGFKNKTEIWKMTSLLRHFSSRIKKIIATKTEQSEKEKVQLLNRAKSLGLISATGVIEDVLDIPLKDLLERRLQSIVFRKGLARSISQARQFITHGHILVRDKKVTSPNFLVKTDQEALVSFIGTSSLANPDHPERIQKESLTKKKEKPKEKKTDKKTKIKKKEAKEEASKGKAKSERKGKKSKENKEAKKK